MARAGIVLQARMGSRRLPGKVLARIGPRTLLDHAVTRLARSGLPVIVATTEGAEDDVVADEARRTGAGVFRGSRADVLRRFVDAARVFGLDLVVRATADNPFVDADGPARVVDLLRRLRADYVLESGLPVGAAVEAVSARALARAAATATDAFDREHVTTLVRRDPMFRSLRAMAPAPLRRADLRLTIDTHDDLAFARRLWDRLDARDAAPPLAAIISAASAIARADERTPRARGA